MKTLPNRMHGFLLLLLLTLPAVVQAQLAFITNNGAITITGYTGSGAVVIPDTTNGYPVTSIQYVAFSYASGVTSVTIPDSVTNIGSGAFQDCGNLTNVTIGTNVVSIEATAFYSCTSLTNITIPNSVTSIGGSAFQNCTDLTAITVDTLNPIYSSVDGVLFGQNQTLLIQFPGGKAGNYTVPDSVTSIGTGAFQFCNNVTNVTIGNGVTNIGFAAFAGCYSLASVTIPESVVSIGDDAFVQCSLTSVTIPKSVTNIGISVFTGCGNLAAIAVDAFNSFFSSAAGVLYNKNQTTLIEYPGGKAGNYTVSNSVTSISDEAFANCTRLTGVTIPNSVTNMGQDVFFRCVNLTNVMIGNNVTNIGINAFAFCTSLTSITIPKSVIGIGDLAFHSCTKLTGIYFQGNAPSVPNAGFLSPFNSDSNTIVYYLPGKTGWGATFGGRPTVLWNPLAQTSDASFGVRTNQFGFNIIGSSNLVIVVEACTNLFNPVWQPVRTNTLTDGTAYFSDPQWTNFPGRFYRLRSPE